MGGVRISLSSTGAYLWSDKTTSARQKSRPDQMRECVRTAVAKLSINTRGSQCADAYSNHNYRLA